MGVWYISLAFKQRPVSRHLQALRQEERLSQHSTLGSLSKGVFEPRTSTVTEAFFILIGLDTTKIVLLSVSSPACRDDLP